MTSAGDWTIESIGSRRGRDVRLDEPAALRRWLAGESMKVKRTPVPVLFPPISDERMRRIYWC